MSSKEESSSTTSTPKRTTYRAMSTTSVGSIDSMSPEQEAIPLTAETLEQHRKAAAAIAPILEGYSPQLSKSEIVSPAQDPISRTASNISSLSISHARVPDLQPPRYEGSQSAVSSSPVSADASIISSGRVTPKNKPRTFSASLPQSSPKKQRIGTIGVCAMDNKVLSKPCRQILNRLLENGDFDTVIFGDKVILDETIENWPTCDFLISFFSNGFPLQKAIDYANLRKPFLLNDLIMQKALWDRRLCLKLLKAANVPTPFRLCISRDGGPKLDADLKKKLEDTGIDCNAEKEPEWKMIDEDTLMVDGKIMHKPFVEKPVDGENHNIFIYYPKKNGGGGRRLFRKIGNKSSEFDPTLNMIRTDGSYIYEEFIDTDNFEDVKAYTVGPTYCHAETRKSPVVDGIVRRNNNGKEIRYVTELSKDEEAMAARVCTFFQQTICGFDLLRTNGKSYVIDVNGFSFVKDNAEYYDRCAAILKQMFIDGKRKRPITARARVPTEERKQKWVFKGFVSIVRHADRTPKQKFKYSFRSPIFLSLLKGYKEEVVIREVRDLEVVLKTVHVAQEQHLEDDAKLLQLATALEKKMNFPGTKVQLKPALNDDNEIEKVQLILKWGGEPTHSAKYQATDLGESCRQDIQLLNQKALEDVQVFTSSERRVLASAQLFSKTLLGVDQLPENFLQVRKDLLDDSNAAKDLMDKVKKKLKPLLRQGAEAPPQFAWPPKMPEPYVVIQRVVELMNYHKRIMTHNFATKDVDSFQEFWCTDEDPFLFKERWDKLFQEFVTVEKVHPSKISELYDTMKFDALHNRDFLRKVFDPAETEDLSHLHKSLVKEYPINVLAMNGFKMDSPNENTVGSIGWVLSSAKTRKHREEEEEHDGDSPFDAPKYEPLRELYRLSKVLFDFICPQEYGISDNEKLDIGLLTSLPLAKQLVRDIKTITDTDKAATRVYFTKESHIYTLLNVIYESDIPINITRNALPELDYLSQIVFEMYESESDNGEEKKHSIRVSLSPGCHTQDPLDVQLDERHYISCIRRINLTRHLDTDLILRKMKSRFSRVSLPKKFTPVNITSPLVEGKP